jgi:hypothetical protein
MSSSSTHSTRSPRRPRVNPAQKALLWLAVIVLAVYPFPGWW